MQWPTESLSELCHVQLGKTPSRGNARFWDKEKETENVWLSIADLVHGEEVADSKEYVTDRAAEDINLTPAGTLLLSFKLTIGRVSFAAKDLYTNEAIASLVGLSRKVDKRFLYYYFSGYNWDELTEGDIKLKGRTLNKAKLNALPVPLPPLPEQQRIVGKLDAAFAALTEAQAHLERNRANARELFESYLNGVFEGKEYPEVRLGDVCKTGSGGTPLRSRKDFFEGGTIPWLMSGEVAQGEVNSATNFITPLAVANSSAKLFPPDTVLVAMYGATAGQVGILRFEATTNQAVCGIYPNAKFLPEFLFYVFLHKKVELVAQATGGAQPNISQEKIRDTHVPMPSIEQQRKLVKQLSSLKEQSAALETTYQQKLTELTGLKKAVLGAAFRGEL
jgi:type I restriction enzyme S subunit